MKSTSTATYQSHYDIPKSQISTVTYQKNNCDIPKSQSVHEVTNGSIFVVSLFWLLNILCHFTAGVPLRSTPAYLPNDRYSDIVNLLLHCRSKKTRLFVTSSSYQSSIKFKIKTSLPECPTMYVSYEPALPTNIGLS
jgi:hypothetical protein